MARRFADLVPPLSPATLAVVHGLGFQHMTPVQAATIPLFSGNKDVAVEACTGSGKTLAFVLPVVERLLRSEVDFASKRTSVGALVVVPTRELARQIAEVFQLFLEADTHQKGKRGGTAAVSTAPAASALPLPKFRCAVLVGGSEVASDMVRLTRGGCTIIVATPGRLLDIMRREAAPKAAASADGAAAPVAVGPSISFKQLEVLVLDEADALLDLGFADALTEILGHLPKQRRTGLFSATQTREVKSLARAGLRNPAVITVQVQRNGAGAAAAPAAGGTGAGPPPSGASAKAAQKAKRPAAESEVEEAGTSDGSAGEVDLDYADEGDGGDGADAASGGEDDDEEDEEAAAAAGVADGDDEAAAHSSDAATTSAGASGGGGATQSVPNTLQNWYTVCADPVDKLHTLATFLRRRAAAGDKAIVFALTCAAVDYYGRALALPAVRAAAGLPDADAFPILPLHGQMPAKRRTAAYAAFVAAGRGALLCTDVAARGIDVPDVDWIVQFDPPKDPAFYIHRVGRTARAGRRGQALLLLLEKEAPGYLALLAVKRVPIAQWGGNAAEEEAAAPFEYYEAEAAEAAGAGAAGEAGAAGGAADGSAAPPPPAALASGAAAPSAAPSALRLASSPRCMRSRLVRALLLAAASDRDVMERGTKAFVSFLRGYSEHVCRYLFKLEALDVPALAAAFGCVKLPKVTELRARAGALRYPGLPGLDTGAVAYTDPAREAQRQARLLTDGARMAEERAARDARRSRAYADAAAAGGAGGKRKRTHKSHSKATMEDWAVLQAEEALERRMRAGRMAPAEYRAAMAALSRLEGLDDEDADALIDAAVAGEAAPAVAKRARMEHMPGAAGAGHEHEEKGARTDSGDDDDDDVDSEGKGAGGGAVPRAAAGGGGGLAAAVLAAAGADKSDTDSSDSSDESVAQAPAAAGAGAGAAARRGGGAGPAGGGGGGQQHRDSRRGGRKGGGGGSGGSRGRGGRGGGSGAGGRSPGRRGRA